jgi:hypothetical protein
VLLFFKDFFWKKVANEQSNLENNNRIVVIESSVIKDISYRNLALWNSLILLKN